MLPCEVGFCGGYEDVGVVLDFGALNGVLKIRIYGSSTLINTVLLSIMKFLIT
jgi:hypothetical protein